ncbi:Uncharacterized conserved protein [Modicisalibacter ilicicola DSM 19980]|uniref:Uncharacterized conserved protein n=1 Tax=Modicisalibacter ilicicola DSM 19980 TaxID=1121942 RepID=A0A1M4XHH7_9GAMM|nr:RimK/LysX family protein [Halomonas ilicicola]SHE92602.1 Uncharacterized conserved protein [Halomonas ilicicola DSM 19980]
MPTRYLLLSFIAGAGLLAGCAQAPLSSQDDRLDTLATTAELDTMLSGMERRLARQCTNNDHGGALAAQEARLDEIGGEVGEIGSMLRSLRTEIRGLSSETSAPQQECPTSDVAALENKTLLGRNEWVGFPNIGTYLKARIDSGANTGSISAREITEFEREGDDWVRFKLAVDEEDIVVDEARDKWIEAEVTRRVRIIQASGEESRPVITLLMRLGPIKQNVDFTLNDRSHLDFPVLLGRRFMMDIALIDVAQTYLHERPEYPGGEPAEKAAEDEAIDRKDDKE